VSSLVLWPAASWVKKVGEGGAAGSCIFRQTTANFWHRRLWTLKVAIFVPKFRQNRGFPASNFVFLKECMPTRREFSNRLKCMDFPPLSPAPCPLEGDDASGRPLMRLFWRCMTVKLTLETSASDCGILNEKDSLNDGLTERRTTSVLFVFITLFWCSRLTRTYTSTRQPDRTNSTLCVRWTYVIR